MVSDQRQFIDAVSKAKASAGVLDTAFRSFTDDWKAALHACSRLAMFDMLAALAAIDDRRFLVTDTPRNPRAILAPRIESSPDRVRILGSGAFSRIMFAVRVIEQREIEDFGIPEDQVNDGREFLGCTRLVDAGVQKVIDDALSKARNAVALGASPLEPCCGVFAQAWAGKLPGNVYNPNSLVAQRRAYTNASLNSNLAAAAHYFLSRYHVCAAKAAPWQMNEVVEGYDAKKRLAIATGDRDLSTVALTPGNRPFPPDFAIRNWAQKGASEGEVDRLRCNSRASTPVLFPDVNGSEL